MAKTSRSEIGLLFSTQSQLLLIGENSSKTGLQCAISPLHDKDMNPDNTPKKPHYHVILTYSGPTSYNVVKALTDGFNQPIPQALEQVRGYYTDISRIRTIQRKLSMMSERLRPSTAFNIVDFGADTLRDHADKKDLAGTHKTVRHSGVRSTYGLLAG